MVTTIGKHATPHSSTWVEVETNGLRLGEGGVFTTNVDAKNQTLINHKCVCGELNRHFCQTAVSSCYFLTNLIFLTVPSADKKSLITSFSLLLSKR